MVSTTSGFGFSALAVCAMSTVLTPSAVEGAEVTVNFSGVIASSSGPNAQQFHVGEHVTGSYTLRTTASDDVPNNPNEGRYNNALVAAKVTVQESGLTFAHARGPGVAHDVSVFKTVQDDQVAIFAWHRTGGSVLGGEAPCCVNIEFSAPKSADKNRQMLVDDALPIQPLAYTYANISLSTKSGWTQLMIAPPVPPAKVIPRFTPLGNDLVVDNHTGLQWTQSDNGSDINWNNAKNWCAQKGGGFRLPSPEEFYPFIGMLKEFRLTGHRFWTHWHRGPYKAWSVDRLGSGTRSAITFETSVGLRALCVRMAKPE